LMRLFRVMRMLRRRGCWVWIERMFEYPSVLLLFLLQLLRPFLNPDCLLHGYGFQTRAFKRTSRGPVSVSTFHQVVGVFILA
jgi:hypothetical protein